MVEISFSLSDYEYLLLILVRVASFMYIAPIFGHSAVQGRVKIGLAFFVAFILYGVAERPVLEYQSVIGYAVIVLKEGITGLLIGFAANICSSIVLFAGNIIDMDIGLSMATEFNPDSGEEVTVTGNLYYYLVMLLLLASNMHIYILRALCDSFQLIPIGGTQFEWDHLLSAMTCYMLDLGIIGFRIFLPIFACIMVLNCVLGIMSKVSPQMNMFSVGIQLKIIVGFVVLYVTIFLFPSVADYIFKEIRTMVVLFIEGMY